MARTVRDAAILLGALTGIDPDDPATAASDGKSFTDYTPISGRWRLKVCTHRHCTPIFQYQYPGDNPSWSSASISCGSAEPSW